MAQYSETAVRGELLQWIKPLLHNTCFGFRRPRNVILKSRKGKAGDLEGSMDI